MLAIWSLVPLPFLKPAWTSGSSWFTYFWSLAWKILSITLLAGKSKLRGIVKNTFLAFLKAQGHQQPQKSDTVTNQSGLRKDGLNGWWYLLWTYSTQKKYSVQFSRSVMSDSLRPHGTQHTRPPCPSPTPRVYPNSCPLSWWCHPTISSSVVPFSSHLQSFPALGSIQMSQLFASRGQRIGLSASTSVLPMNIQDWSPLGWTGWIALQSKGLSRVFSNITVQKHQVNVWQNQYSIVK